MQPTALVQIAGTIVNVREVVIPPRAATEKSKAYDGGAYVEATLSTPAAALAGEQVDGLVAFLTVRFSTDEPLLGQLASGVEVDLLCSTFVETYRVRGSWGNSVAYRFSRSLAVRQARPVAA